MEDLLTFLDLPQMVSVRELQRNYRKIFNKVKSTKEPVLISCRGRPEVVIVSLKFLQDIAHKLKNLGLLSLSKNSSEIDIKTLKF